MPNYEITMDVEDSGSGTIVDPTQLNDAGNAKRAEAWAVGQRNGVDVPSTDPTYHNNSKYYAQQAGSSAGSASSSADAAAAAAQHYPYVDSTSGNWMVWNTSTGAFVDTGVHAQGPTGPTGPGVPSGGTAGQVLKKVNGTDYNAEWANNDGTTIPMSSSDSTSINEAIANVSNLVFPASVGTEITSATDFNTFVSPGVRTFASNTTISNSANKPCSYAGRLVVWTINGSNLNTRYGLGGQIYIDFKGNQYVRSATADSSGVITWGSWDSYALKSDLSSLITEEIKYTESVTIGANAYKATTVTVTKSGYTPFGIVGYNSFDVDVFCVSAYVSDATTIGLTLRNLNSSSKSGTFGIRVAYKKNL